VDIPWSDRKHYIIGIGIMLTVVLILGVHSRATVNAVLGDKVPVAATTVAHTRLVNDELRRVTQRDQQVASAIMAEDLDDPFLSDKPRNPPMADKTPRKVNRLVKPRLAALIFDDVSPTVQIRIGGVRSDWLRTGDRFKGWQVADITASSVKVMKGDREVVLK